MELSRIKEFAEKWGFDDVKFLVEWRGYDVYDGIFAPERKGCRVGLPFFFLVKDDEIRLTEYLRNTEKSPTSSIRREEDDEEEDE